LEAIFYTKIKNWLFFKFKGFPTNKLSHPSYKLGRQPCPPHKKKLDIFYLEVLNKEIGLSIEFIDVHVKFHEKIAIQVLIE